MSWILLVPACYLAITLLLLARLIYNLLCLHKIAAASSYIPDVTFRELAHDTWLKSGAFLKPRIAVSSAVRSPLTFDSDDSWILLPETWTDWTIEKLKAVLTHEMAHVQRRDSRTLLQAALATCIFWFHPLAWFLKRSLAALAEESCDEIVIALESSPRQYANFLIDFAYDLQQGYGRLAYGAIAMAAKSGLKRRIQRLFEDTAVLHSHRRLLAALSFALFLPALYLTAAARPGAPQAEVIAQSDNPEKWIAGASLTPEAAADLEAAFKANPQDIDTRSELLIYYANHGLDQAFKVQYLWFINHYPSASSLAMGLAMFRSSQSAFDADAEQQITSAWDQAIATHQDSPQVFANGASFFESANPERALQLLQQANKLDPANKKEYTRRIASLYAYALAQEITGPDVKWSVRMSAEAATKLRTELANSQDPTLWPKPDLPQST